MARRKRTEFKTVGTISEFMGGRVAEKAKTEAEKKRYEVGVLPVTIGGGALVLAPMTALAAEPPEVIEVFSANPADLIGQAMLDKVIGAFEPVVGLVQALAYPVGLIALTGGALFIMTGNRERGFGLMQGASLGYLLVQASPLFMKLLAEIGGQVF